MSTSGFGHEGDNGGNGGRPPGRGGFEMNNGSDGQPWPALAMRVEPVEIVPGVPAQVVVAVRNDSGMAADVRFDVAGLNSEWVAMPEPAGPLGPGDTLKASLTVTLPAGYPSSELRAALHARALGPGPSSLSAGRRRPTSSSTWPKPAWWMRACPMRSSGPSTVGSTSPSATVAVTRRWSSCPGRARWAG